MLAASALPTHSNRGLADTSGPVGASNLDMLRCSMTYSKPEALVEAFKRVSEVGQRL